MQVIEKKNAKNLITYGMLKLKETDKYKNDFIFDKFFTEERDYKLKRKREVHEKEEFNPEKR